MSSPPFGIEKGDSKNEIKVGEEISRWVYAVTDTPKPHPDFSIVYAQITPLNGVSHIKAISKIISTDEEGEKLKGRFNTFTDILSKKYGQPYTYDNKTDLVRIQMSFNGNLIYIPWMNQLVKHEAKLFSVWGKVLPNDLRTVRLDVTAKDSCNGNLELNYYFDNFDLAIQEIQNFEEDIL